MYNNFIKLTEQYRRDDTRTIYVNPAHIEMATSIDGKTRLWIGRSIIIDVLEPLTAIIDPNNAVVLTDKVEDVGNRNEDGRVSNPAK